MGRGELYDFGWKSWNLFVGLKEKFVGVVEKIKIIGLWELGYWRKIQTWRKERNAVFEATNGSTMVWRFCKFEVGNLNASLSNSRARRLGDLHKRENRELR